VGFWSKTFGFLLFLFCEKCEFGHFWSKKVGFWPFLFEKWAGLKPSNGAGLRVFWSFAHFYFIFFIKKNF
jgi:hypothetical protein